jgi:LAGLIDADG endonuclease
MNTRDMTIWAAGFIDGEGCVSIGRAKAKDHNWYSYTLNLAVSQKTEAPLKRLHEMFGGHLFNYKSRGVVYYRWQHWGPGALAAIKELLPYLFVKREVAEVGIRFQEQMTAWNKEYGRRGYPEEVVTGRELFWSQARALNARNRANHREPKYEGPRAFAQISSNSVN